MVELPEHLKKACDFVYEASAKFFSQGMEYKAQFQGSVEGRLAPKFGYRRTLLRKEFFVFRNVQDGIPCELECMRDAFQQMGTFSMDLLATICGDEADVAARMGANPLRAVSSAELSHSSFWETFRYECDGQHL